MMKHLPLKMVLIIVMLICIGCATPTNKRSSSSPKRFQQQGEASFYAMKFQSRKTASGEIFNQSAMTGAHKKLPFGTMVRVTNVDNNKSVIVRINDRGPFVRGRIIDLSRSAFSKIGDLKMGVIRVKIQVVE